MAGIDLGVTLLRERRTRIVATLGPASSSRAAIRAVLAAGADVVRLNFSHGTMDEHARAARHVRGEARALGRHVAIVGDLAGPKMRTGRFQGGAVLLHPGERVVVTTRPVVGRAGLIPSQYRALPRDVRAGESLLLDDGNLELVVERVAGHEVRCRVVQGGTLRDHKGINLPGSRVSAPSLTAKDRLDAAAALARGIVDLLALSFVRSARDVLALKRHLRRLGHDLPVIAKIEKPQALDEIDAILAVADAIMVARGDLGVELPPERVPIAQRELVRRAIAADRPVIVATQMLESMIENARPTRAEVSDVASAVFASADAVMLSAETASGRHPVAAVRMMDRIVREVEGWLWGRGAFGSAFELRGAPAAAPGHAPPPKDDLHQAIGRATALLSWDLKVRCIVVPSRGGHTARAVAADRPEAPVVAVCHDAAVLRRLCLSWGVVPVRARTGDDASIETLARRIVRERRLAPPGSHVLVVRGFDPDPARSRPSVTVLTV